MIAASWMTICCEFFFFIAKQRVHSIPFWWLKPMSPNRIFFKIIVLPYHSSLSFRIVKTFHRQHMIDTRVQADFIHDRNPSINRAEIYNNCSKSDISANPGLNFNRGLFFFSLKAFSRTISLFFLEKPIIKVWTKRINLKWICLLSFHSNFALILRFLTSYSNGKAKVSIWRGQTPYNWLWLWRWLPHRLWERQPLPATDLIRTYTILIVTIYQKNKFPMNASSKLDTFRVITSGVILLLQVAHNL